MSKHTSGPWRTVIALNAPEVAYYIYGGPHETRYVGAIVFTDDGEDEANATLIASAPRLKAERDELLTALKALAHVAVWDEDSNRKAFDKAYALAEAAIQLVEG